MVVSGPMRAAIPVTVLLMLLLALPGIALAQERTPIDVSALGPQVGERVPDFSLPDQTGQLHTLRTILRPNGSLILFHRSADW